MRIKIFYISTLSVFAFSSIIIKSYYIINSFWLRACVIILSMNIYFSSLFLILDFLESLISSILLAKDISISSFSTSSFFVSRRIIIILFFLLNLTSVQLYASEISLFLIFIIISSRVKRNFLINLLAILLFFFYFLKIFSLIRRIYFLFTHSARFRRL